MLTTIFGLAAVAGLTWLTVAFLIWATHPRGYFLVGRYWPRKGAVYRIVWCGFFRISYHATKRKFRVALNID